MPKGIPAEATEAAEKVKRLTVSPEFDEVTYNKIKKLAESDERSMAQWLSRYVRMALNQTPKSE